jgi:hypothetical protein
MFPELNRIPPALPAAAMKTYEIDAPLATHFRQATCAEVQCDAHRLGWQTEVDESAELGQRQAYYIRHDSTRKHAEERREDGTTVFTFEAGQHGFSHDHRLPTGRPERLLVLGGDWRGNPLGIRPRVHVSADDWVEDMQESLDKIRTAHERG